jgi:phosphate transport system substrate-binding protein
MPAFKDPRQSRNLHGWITSVLVLCLFQPLIAQDNVVFLVGSGSNVPAPLFDKWAEAYNERKFSTQLRYLPIGTNEGIEEISHGSGDFGAGEVPLTAEQRARGKLTEVPSILIGIVPVYNLPQLHAELRFSGELLAEVFLGRVKTWSAPEVARLNPGVKLPDLPIRVVYRPAGKGSNYVFTDFLSKTSARFRAQIGVSPSPHWPVGVPAERNSDVIDKVKEATGSIGYVEYQYAARAGVPYGLVQNASGRFVKASPDSITAACTSVEAPQWDKFAASLTNASGAESYPIASFTFLYLRTASHDPQRRAALDDLLNWIFDDGELLAHQEGYSELPPALLHKVKTRVASFH